jgi:hypothetical protein
MAKIDKIRLVVDSRPGNSLASFPIIGKLAHRFILRGNDPVAAHTSFQRRNAGDTGARCLCVAVKALDTSLDVSPVTVADGLFRHSQETLAGNKDGHPNNDDHRE